MLNQKRAISRLHLFLGVEMIAPTLMKAILKHHCLRTSFIQLLNLRDNHQDEETMPLALKPGCRTVSNNGSGSGLVPAQNILAAQVWFGFT